MIELLVTICIICLLAALLYPALSKLSLKSKESKSLANLRAIGQGVHLYVSDNQGFLPLLAGNSGSSFAAPFWCREALIPYLPASGGHQNSSVMFDPLVPAGSHSSLSDYAANFEVLRGAYPGYVAQGALPLNGTAGRMAKLIMVVAAEDPSRPLPNGTWYMDVSAVVANPSGPYARPSDRGLGRICSLFVDGHTEAVSKADFYTNRASYLLLNP